MTLEPEPSVRVLEWKKRQFLSESQANEPIREKWKFDINKAAKKHLGLSLCVSETPPRLPIVRKLDDVFCDELDGAPPTLSAYRTDLVRTT